MGHGQSKSVTTTQGIIPLEGFYFEQLPWLLVEMIFESLNSFDEKGNRAIASEKRRLMLFLALMNTAGDDYLKARYGAVMAMQEQFSQYVLDGELTKAELVLKIAKSNPCIFAPGQGDATRPRYALRDLLTTNKKLTEKCRLFREGTSLELAYGAWDWAPFPSEKPAMVEMLCRYFLMLSQVKNGDGEEILASGEELIAGIRRKILPEGFEAHLKAQQAQAAEFAKAILEPLADSIQNASDADINLAHGLTDIENEEVDTYIATNLAGTALWTELMKHRATLRKFMQEETRVFNPYLLQQAIQVCVAKYKVNEWQDNLSEGWDRLGLLSIHAIGGIQACCPTHVQTLFASGAIWDFYTMSDKQRKNFESVRSTAFKSGGGDMGDCSGAGLGLLGLKFYAARIAGGGSWQRLPAWVPAEDLEIFCRSKNTTLGNPTPRCRIEPTQALNAAPP